MPPKRDQIHETMDQNHHSMNINILSNLKMLKEANVAEKNFFKVKAYNTAISTISKLREQVTEQNIDSIDGLSKNMKEKVLEIITTGHLQAVENINSKDRDMYAAVEALTKVMGIGPVKAKDLKESHDVSNVDELRLLLQRNPDALTDMQKIGVEYFDDISQRIPYKEMVKHDEYIQKIVQKYGNYEIVGSYRRKEKTSGDIDVLVSLDDNNLDKHADWLCEIANALYERGYIKEKIALGQKKFMGMCKLPRHKTHRRLDIRVCLQSQYPFMVLYFTGSDQFNVKMRTHCLNKGYSMNEYGLTAITEDAKHRLKSATFHTEKDIFDFVEYVFVPPDKRSL